MQDVETPYWVILVLAASAGSAAATSRRPWPTSASSFPKARKGTALGLNAGLGNLGVSSVQFVVPLVITVGIFGSFGGEPQTGAASQAERRSRCGCRTPASSGCRSADRRARLLVMNDIADARATFSRTGGDLSQQAQLAHVLALHRHVRFLHRLLGRLSAPHQEPVSRRVNRARLRLARPVRRRASCGRWAAGSPTRSAVRA